MTAPTVAASDSLDTIGGESTIVALNTNTTKRTPEYSASASPSHMLDVTPDMLHIDMDALDVTDLVESFLVHVDVVEKTVTQL